MAAAIVLFASSCLSIASAEYRFDDIYGPSGIGGQWIAVTAGGDTVGAPLTTTMLTGADFVNVRDSVKILNRLPAGESIESLFMVIPESTATLGILFSWLVATPPGTAYTQDILTDFKAYTAVKEPLNPFNLWDLHFEKTSSSSLYESARGNMIFQQNPATLPSQTLQIPFIIANVHNGTAEGNPLLFRSAMRETYSGASGGDIVAYDRFTWDVTSDIEVGGSNSDWVFVPVKSLPIDSNRINYTLTTDVTNYSGIRYALQRYDGFVWAPMFPTRWAMDVPAGTGDVTPEIILDELSHIPPGLITTYSQPFNVVSGVKGIFHMYPVDPASGYRNMTLSHPSIFGLDLGSENDTDYTVSGFKLLSSDPDFVAKAAAAAGVGKVDMVNDEDGVMSGITSQGYVAGDAINTLAIDAQVPSRFVSAKDTKSLLPLHITFKMPRSNRFIAPKWDALLTEWKRSGRIRTLFGNSFTVYISNSDGKSLDLFNWLRGKGMFDKTVKVFLDEQKECITVSFIAMLVDGGERKIGLAQDKSVTTDNSYIVIQDGTKNDRMDLTFFTAPTEYVPDTGPDTGGGGGGCSGATTAAPIVAIICAAALALRNTRFRKGRK